MGRQRWIGHSLLGRYRLDELLGQGGMSAVYKATDPNLKRVVAVKMIHPHLSSDPEFVRRFETEAAAVAQLRHANIIQVYDFNHEDQTYFMVLEFIPGETLQDRLKRLNQQGQVLPLDEIVRYGSGIAEAADYAHKRGMVHRDIKPANVLLNLQNEAILMDFGIARIVGEQHFTATGAVLGTALYMAPEQIRGEHPDHRADIYSLGVMLYEMVCGRPPFEADSAMTVMMMHLNDPVPDLASINPATPPELKAIIEKALAKNANERFDSAAEMSQALQALLAPTPSETQPEAGPAAALGTAAAAATLADSPEATLPDTGIPDQQTQAEPVEATLVEEVAPAPTPPPGAGAAGAPPPPASAGPDTAGGSGGIPRIALFAGGGIILIIIVAVLASLFLGGSGTAPLPEENTPTPIEATEVEEIATEVPPTETPIPPTATETPLPSPTPTVTTTPTETVPPGPYVRINDIYIEGGNYVVEYETFEYIEELPGMHVHFYYDTVSEANAGIPGSGPWILYGGPRPFTEYSTNSRPPAATQMCARVANPNHSIQPGSGNCFDLPDA